MFLLTLIVLMSFYLIFKMKQTMNICTTLIHNQGLGLLGVVLRR